MNSQLIRTSLSNSIYFSVISFILIGIASFLYQYLEKTIGRLDMGVVIIIVLSLMLIMFFLAITNIMLSEYRQKTRFFERIMGVLLFLIVSGIILGVLVFLFWFKI